ncbi:MAG: hypothetical protein J6O50_04075 [Ruminiclostridium sp.]|nr:hypothetical protein [Ruminiclostridium sp.]
MATKSILKDVRIKDKNLGKSLANALENACCDRIKPVQFQRTPIEVKKEDIKKLFGKKDT